MYNSSIGYTFLNQSLNIYHLNAFFRAEWSYLNVRTFYSHYSFLGQLTQLKNVSKLSQRIPSVPPLILSSRVRTTPAWYAHYWLTHTPPFRCLVDWFHPLSLSLPSSSYSLPSALPIDCVSFYLIFVPFVLFISVFLTARQPPLTIVMVHRWERARETD